MTFVDIKVILLGDVSVGKTSIFIRFFESKWNRKYHQNTIGFVYKSVEIESTGNKWNVGVWDTAGSERYTALSSMYYRNTTCAILCFDPSVPKTWDRVVYWYEELMKNAEDCKIYICATKKDLLDDGSLSYEVDMSEVDKFVKSIDACYFHVSSKTGENVSQLFQNLVDNCTADPVFLENWQERVKGDQDKLDHSKMRDSISEKYSKSESSCCVVL